MTLKPILAAALISIALISCSTTKSKNNISAKIPKPIQLFNGKDLKNWTPKIRLHEVGENYKNTFRVEDGLLKVRYDGYDNFDRQYGHLGYNSTFSYYVLRIEYRFLGDQANGGESWAWRNSGAMLHGQAPNTMLKNQDFPISIEAQLLGGDTTPTSIRTTSNLCTPGTNVVYRNELFTPHCVNSSSKTYHGDQWVIADFIVLGDSVIRHVLEGETVLEYYKPQIGGGSVSDYDKSQKNDGQLLKEGYIYLQSESHPIDFRKVELYNLDAYKNKPEDLKKITEAITASQIKK